MLRKIILVLLLVYSSMVVTNMMLYEENVYDCSNMCADQKYVLDKLGFDTCYVLNINEHHVYLCIRDLHIGWEATGLYPRIRCEGE